MSLNLKPASSWKLRNIMTLSAAQGRPERAPVNWKKSGFELKVYKQYENLSHTIHAVTPQDMLDQKSICSTRTCTSPCRQDTVTIQAYKCKLKFETHYLHGLEALRRHQSAQAGDSTAQRALRRDLRQRSGEGPAETGEGGQWWAWTPERIVGPAWHRQDM